MGESANDCDGQGIGTPRRLWIVQVPIKRMPECRVQQSYMSLQYINHISDPWRQPISLKNHTAMTIITAGSLHWKSVSVQSMNIYVVIQSVTAHVYQQYACTKLSRQDRVLFSQQNLDRNIATMVSTPPSCVLYRQRRYRCGTSLGPQTHISRNASTPHRLAAIP
jgi:hypothetical protein